MVHYTTFTNLRVTGDFDADNAFNASTLPVTATGSTTARTLAARFAGMFNVEDFGAAGNGTTDDTAAFTAAFAALGTAGGTIRAAGRYLIDTTLTIPRNCALVGAYRNPGQQPTVGTPQSYDALGSTLIVNSAATINMSYSTSIEGFCLKRKGMAATPWADATVAAAQIAAYAGTAITIGDVSTPLHDTYCGHLLILGFAQAISAYRCERQRLEYVSFDCTAGIANELNTDITHVNFCHAWNFLTAQQAWVTDALKIKTGAAFRCANIADWIKFTNCFSFGHAIGYDAESADHVTFLGCGADYPSALSSTSIGFKISGTAKEASLLGCQAAAQGKGVSIDIGTAPNKATARVIACNFWNCDSRGVEITTGTAVIQGCAFSGGVGRHVAALSGATGVTIAGCSFDALDDPIYVDAAISTAAVNTYGNTFLNITAGAGYQMRLGPHLRSVDTANAVNRIVITPGATGSPVQISAEGDANAALTLAAAGSGAITLKKAGGGVVVVNADSSNSSLELYGAGANFVRIGNGNGVHLIAGTGTAGTYVNNIRAVGSTTGNSCVLLSEGTDANVAFQVRGKGTGGVQIEQSGGRVGFYGTTAAAKGTITGSRGGNAALASLLTQLATHGLITDSTTA